MAGSTPHLSITIEDGKGVRSTMSMFLERFDYEDYALGDITTTPWHESMADNILQDLEPIIDGKIISAQFVWPVVLDFTPQEADPNSDVEEGALFSFITDGGFPVKIRVPTFKESLFVSGTTSVDLSLGVVQDFVNTILDGPDAIPGAGEDRFNVTDNRGEDIEYLDSAEEDFTNNRRRGRRRR